MKMPTIKTMFHTQGYRLPYLKSPMLCTRKDAWLGNGYYFWYDEQDAILWGQNSKKEYRKYVVYKSNIDCADILNTVFNEDHYILWSRTMDRIADDITKKTGKKASIEQINDMIKYRNVWKSVKGILFQDLPNNPALNKVITLLYRKRIQLAVYNPDIIYTFAVHFEAEC